MNVSAHAQVLVTLGQNFTGTSYDPNAPVLPPDANGAIGPRHFMEFINGTVAVYNKTNGQSIQRKTNVKFWSDAGLIISPDSSVSDPRVIYDPTVQRWFASQVDFNANGADPTASANDFLLAVSATDNPAGSWHGFQFQSDPDFGNFADFPTLGLDSNAIYLSGDFFHTNLAIGPGLVSIPKADLLTATPTIANRTWFGVMDYAVRGQVLQPAICLDGSSVGNILAMEDIGTDTNPHSNIVSFVVQNAVGPGIATLTTSTSIPVSPYVVPYNADLGTPFFNPLQPDGTTTLAANDARLSAKVYAVGGVLYAVNNTELNNRIAVRWYRINAANHALLESGTIADTNLDLFFPSICANANGTVVIACNGSGINTFVSCFAAVGHIMNGVTTFGSLILLKSGTVSYHGDDELIAELLGDPLSSRWGDYSATSVDPADPSRFWTIQMYPSDTNVWSTQITELITVPLPSLTIATAGTNVLVSWPAFATGFQLQSTPALLPTNNWSLVTQTLVTNGNLISTLVPISGTQKYFRLKQGP
jgi:hypothetical protein